MKILYLFHFKKHNNYDHYLNIDFANYIKCYPGIELMGYGLDLTEHDPNLAPLKYNTKINLSDIYQQFKFDVIIVNTKGRCFEYYNPHNNESKNMCLPSDFASWNKTPKIIFEEDYHYEKNDEWYLEQKFDLILQRHYSQSLREENVPMKFFPFSVDTSLFNTHKIETIHKGKPIRLPYNSERKNKIAFVGNDGDKAYIYRFNAIRKLVPLGIADNYSAVEPNAIRRVDGEYIKLLREYVAHISCGSTYEICAGKNLEIMASGSLLFTNKFIGIDKLFPKNCYVSYENDWSDLIAKAKMIINEPYIVKETVTNARKCILENHTHDIRIKELIDIIWDLTYNKIKED